MSEIEKMYENAGIEKCNSSLKEIMPDICLKNNEDENYKCEDCEYNWYPEFTAEKQLELIKWLARKGLLQINYSSHQCYQFNSLTIGGNYKASIDKALASHINNLWQDLTNQERIQIAEILRI